MFARFIITGDHRCECVYTALALKPFLLNCIENQFCLFQREELRKRILQLNLPLGSIPDTPMLKRFITKIRAKKNCAGHPKKAKEEVDVDIEIMKLLRDRMLKRTKRGRPRKYTGELLKCMDDMLIKQVVQNYIYK